MVLPGRSRAEQGQRRVEVLRIMKEDPGLSNMEISRRTQVSVSTVREIRMNFLNRPDDQVAVHAKRTGHKPIFDKNWKRFDPLP
jgi:hypothetical protein